MAHFAKVLHRTRVDLLSHAIEIHQETEKDFVAGRAVFVNAIKIAQYGDTGDVFAVESQNTVGLWAHRGAAVGSGHLAMKMLVLHIVRSGNFGEKPCYHLNDVFDGHTTNLILRTLISALLSKSLAVLGQSAHVIVGQGLNVREILDDDASRRGRR